MAQMAPETAVLKLLHRAEVSIMRPLGASPAGWRQNPDSQYGDSESMEPA